MTPINLSGGECHELPDDLCSALHSNKLENFWENLTVLARNEWICWIISAKKTETRKKRIVLACKFLSDGKKRPCCWPGCKHRTI